MSLALIEPSDISGLISHVASTQFLLFGIVDSIVSLYKEAISIFRGLQSSPQLLHLAAAHKKLRDTLVMKLQHEILQPQIMQAHHVLVGIDNRIPFEILHNIDLDKMKFARITVNDTINVSKLHIPSLPTESSSWGYGNASWKLSHLKELRESAKTVGISVNPLKPLLDHSGQNIIIREMMSLESYFIQGKN